MDVQQSNYIGGTITRVIVINALANYKVHYIALSQMNNRSYKENERKTKEGRSKADMRKGL